MQPAALVALLLVPLASAGTPTWSQVVQGGWTDHASRDHADAGTVKVQKRTIAGIACFQGIATTEVPRDVLLAVATDIRGTLRWSTAGVKEAEVLGNAGGFLDYYQYLDVPGWTFASDRFWFLRGSTQVTATSSTFHWDRLAEGGPYAARYAAVKTAHPDSVEPPVNVGGWVFTEEAGKTRINYYICSDTGGAVPANVQNLATTRTLPDTVGDLVREGRKRAAR